MITALLAAEGVAKLGAAVGAGLAAIGAGIGIGRLAVLPWTLWPVSRR